MEYRFEPMDVDSAREILSWTYRGPYTLYNVRPGDDDDPIGSFLTPESPYFALRDEAATLVGYCCFGVEATVPGHGYEYGDDALDVGVGMRPDLTGKGQGTVVAQQVFAFARDRYRPARLRVTVASFNARARSLVEKLGFVDVGGFVRDEDGTEFVVYLREATTEF